MTRQPRAQVPVEETPNNDLRLARTEMEAAAPGAKMAAETDRGLVKPTTGGGSAADREIGRAEIETETVKESVIVTVTVTVTGVPEIGMSMESEKGAEVEIGTDLPKVR